jgi:hypothetical protein
LKEDYLLVIVEYVTIDKRGPEAISEMSGHGSAAMPIMQHARYLALALALTMASGGCHHANGHDRYWSDRGSDDDFSDDNDAAGFLVLLSLVLGLAIIFAIVDGLTHPAAQAQTPSRDRLLESVRGQLVDAEGRPIAGAQLVVREAKRYTAQPEILAAVTYQSGPDGRFVLQMFKTNALCVDIAADGKPMVRRWIVAIQQDALQGLPADQRQIIFVSPHVREADVSQLVITDR